MIDILSPTARSALKAKWGGLSGCPKSAGSYRTALVLVRADEEIE